MQLAYASRRWKLKHGQNGPLQELAHVEQVQLSLPSDRRQVQATSLETSLTLSPEENMKHIIIYQLHF